MGGSLGGGAFDVDPEAYDSFMGRYSRPLAELLADRVDVASAGTVLDVGCGPGALTGVLVARLGADRVAAVDPSPTFAAACRSRHPGVDVRVAAAESLPFDDAAFDRVLASLVLHFVADPPAAAREFLRVLAPGGVAAVTVWDFADGMELLRRFWDAALSVDPHAPDEARVLRFGEGGEGAELFEAAGLVDVVEQRLTVRADYEDVDELWSTFLGGVGPVGAYCATLDEDVLAALRSRLVADLGDPAGRVQLVGVARCTTGVAPR